MALSMYQASAPVFVRGLQNLSAILEKAKAEVAAGRVPEPELIEAQLAPEMFPLPRQVQIAGDMAKGCIARLSGVEASSFEDTETTLSALQDRIARTIAFIAQATPEAIDGTEDRSIVLKLRDRELTLQGQTYLLSFVLPNFYFHITTAYGILRHKGVALTKQDFLGGA